MFSSLRTEGTSGFLICLAVFAFGGMLGVFGFLMSVADLQVLSLLPLWV